MIMGKTLAGPRIGSGIYKPCTGQKPWLASQWR